MCISSSDIQAAVATARTTPALSALLNTSNLASIISNNTNYLDSTTANYVKSLTNSQLTTELNNITVAMGVNKSVVDTLAANYGVSIPAGTQAVSVGNTVLVFSELPTNSNGRITRLDDANLLAHESIHTLQINARGSTEAFLNEYNTDPAMYFSQELEKTAYNFGPYNQNAINAGSLATPILNQQNNQGWFR
jgi:hypothetical protein